MHIDNLKLLLNIGEEENKGNSVKAYQLLKNESSINLLVMLKAAIYTKQS